MKTLYYNAIHIAKMIPVTIQHFFRKEEIPTDEELDALENDLEYQEFDKAMSEVDFLNIPFIRPASSVLLMTLNPDNSKINYFNESYYRRKINYNCRVLLKSGYTNFIANAGTQYGMLAMDELLKMKKMDTIFNYTGRQF